LTSGVQTSRKLVPPFVQQVQKIIKIKRKGRFPIFSVKVAVEWPLQGNIICLL